MRIVHNYGGKWEEDAHIGTHIPLPLDPAQFDAAGVKAMVRACLGKYTEDAHPIVREATEREMRAALAAYAQAVGGAP